MLFEDVYIRSTASWLPEVVPVEEAIGRGLVDDDHQHLGYESIAVSDDLSGPEMAVLAGQRAVERSGVDPADVGLLLHASCSYQGHDMWPSAAYVAMNVVGPSVAAFDVLQRCNGGLGGLFLAASHLLAGGSTAAVVTTGDRFAAPWVDRWNVQQNFIFADGGSAAVLSRRPGFARLIAGTLGADNSLEGWNRGTEPFATAPGPSVDLQGRGMQHAGTPAAEGSWERYEAALARTVGATLEEAKVRTSDIARVVVPLIHRGRSPENYELLGFTEEQSTWDIGRRFGHMGPGDQFLGLEHLVRTRAVSPGDLVLVVAAGEGFSFSSAVLEVLDPPSW